MSYSSTTLKVLLDGILNGGTNTILKTVYIPQRSISSLAWLSQTELHRSRAFLSLFSTVVDISSFGNIVSVYQISHFSHNILVVKYQVFGNCPRGVVSSCSEWYA